MANVSEKKRKLLLLLKILWEKTDGEHTLTLPQLLDELESQGIEAERKSIYDDIETLRSVGIQIETRKNRTFQYYVEKRSFTLRELQFLAEAVRADQSLSQKQKADFIERLGTLCSGYQADLLKEGKAAPLPAEPDKGEKPGKPEKPMEKVILEFPADLLESVQERFGEDLSVEPAGKNRLRAAFRVKAGGAFLSWLFLHGPDVKLIAPKKLAEQLREKAKGVAKLYKN